MKKEKGKNKESSINKDNRKETKVKYKDKKYTK